jgi:hypothetical protein
MNASAPDPSGAMTIPLRIAAEALNAPNVYPTSSADSLKFTGAKKDNDPVERSKGATSRKSGWESPTDSSLAP